MKHILVVTGSDYTEQVYQAFEDAKKIGHKLYLLSDGSFKPKNGIFEKHFTCDLRKTGKALTYMRKQPVKFDAITIKTSEWLTPLVALLCQQYKCIGNTPLTAFNCRSKYHMRRTLENNGIPIPKYALCRTMEELQRAILTIGRPCVAKPVGGNASYGTFLIRKDTPMREIKNNYKNSLAYLRKKALTEDVFAFKKQEMDAIGVEEKVDMVEDYIVEEFMDGKEISVDALTQNGQTAVMGIADQVRMPLPYFVQLAEYMPFKCTKKLQREIEELTQKTISAMGITDSPSHTEIMITKNGLKIVEIGCRIGGDNIHDAVLQVTGYNLMFEAIMIALGVKRTYKIKPRCHTAMQYLLPRQKGVIKKIILPQKIKKDPTVTEYTITANAGDMVAPPPEMFDFLGYVSVTGNSPAEAKTNLKRTVDQIQFVIQSR